MTAQTIRSPRGIATRGNSLYVAYFTGLVRLVGVTPLREDLFANDLVYVPRTTWHTGPLWAHDIGLPEHGPPIFCNTLYSCLSQPDDEKNITFLWHPKFITLAPEDRCHLNGLAMLENKPKYVTCVGTGNTNHSWKRTLADGGCVIEVDTNELVARGLSLPHSPRLHGSRLFICNSGCGEVGEVDRQSGEHTAIARFDGLTRGLAVVGNDLVVGVSLLDAHFNELPVSGRAKLANRCSLQVLDSATGAKLHWLSFGDSYTELYGVACMDAITPTMIRFPDALA
jgi:uncharacterized protein (TIGR03032 family)